MECGIREFSYSTKLSDLWQKRLIEMLCETAILRRGIVESVALLGCYMT
jgi:hypothetical protein